MGLGKKILQPHDLKAEFDHLVEEKEALQHSGFDLILQGTQVIQKIDFLTLYSTTFGWASTRIPLSSTVLFFKNLGFMLVEGF